MWGTFLYNPIYELSKTYLRLTNTICVIVMISHNDVLKYSVIYILCKYFIVEHICLFAAYFFDIQSMSAPLRPNLECWQCILSIE